MLNCQNYLPQEGREHRQRLVLNVQTASFIKWLMFSSLACAAEYIRNILGGPQLTAQHWARWRLSVLTETNNSLFHWSEILSKETSAQFSVGWKEFKTTQKNKNKKPLPVLGTLKHIKTMNRFIHSCIYLRPFVLSTVLQTWFSLHLPLERISEKKTAANFSTLWNWILKFCKLPTCQS